MKLSALGNFYFGNLSFTNLNYEDCYKWYMKMSMSLHPENIYYNIFLFDSNCCSVTKSCLTLCDVINCSMPGLPIPHYRLELAYVHVHWVGDAIQPAHPLLPSSPFAFNLSQHQSLFQWISSSHQLAKVLELQPPMSIQGWFPLRLISLISCCPRGTQESSPAQDFKFINSYSTQTHPSNIHIYTWLL